MKNFLGLRRQMRMLGQMTREEPSQDLEAKLVAAFRRKVRERRRQQVLLAVAASVLLSAGAVFAGREWSTKRLHVPLAATPSVGARANVESGYDSSGFVPLPYAQSGIPLEGAIVVRVDIPASQVEFAIPQIERRSGGQRKVEAELLVGQDGVPRAVRVLK